MTQRSDRPRLVALAFPPSIWLLLALIGVFLLTLPCAAANALARNLDSDLDQQIHVHPSVQDDAQLFRIYERAASLTIPTVGTGTESGSVTPSEMSSGSANGSPNGSATPSASFLLTTETLTSTLVSTSSGSGGTTVGTETETLTIVTSVRANSTGTTTAFPSLSTYSPCVVNCLDTAVAFSNCSTLTDVACYCTNATFARTLFSCVSSNCTDQVGSAEGLAQQFCNLESPSASIVTLSFPSSSGKSSSAINTTVGETATLTSASQSPTSGGSTPKLVGRLQEFTLSVLMVVAAALLCGW